MKKRNVLLIMGLTIALTLTACGEKKTNSEPPKPGATEQTNETEVVNLNDDEGETETATATVPVIGSGSMELHDTNGNVVMRFDFPSGYADFSVDPESGEKVTGEPYEYSTFDGENNEIGISIGANVDDGSTRYITLTCYNVEPDMSMYEKVGEVSSDRTSYEIYKYQFDEAELYNLVNKENRNIQISFGVDGVWAEDEAYVSWTQADVETVVKSKF